MVEPGGGFDLDVEVWSFFVVWVRNDGQVSDTIGVTSTQDNWGPVTDTGAIGTPDTTVLYRNTSVVDVVLSRGLLTLPLVVGVLLDDVDWFGGTGANDGGDDHVLGTWVIGTANSDGAGNLVDGLGGPLAFFTQAVGVSVGTVQLTVLTVQPTNGSTV